MTGQSSPDMTTAIGDNLPYLRRYARALTGRQDSGDRYAAATLEAILNEPELYDGGVSHKVALFRVFHAIWISSGMPVEDGGEVGLAARAQKHLSRLTENTREALLLHTIEEFSIEEVGQIMQVSTEEAGQYVDTAFLEMRDAISGKIMIIEDEAVIAMDLESIVMDMGHRVTGVARTEQSALDLAESEEPDLILSDIQLADDSSGIDAVNRILERDGNRPVIFITAYPERLLTGEGPEPAFLISKPYTENQVRSAVSQALFFASTETLIR
ncbi:response regulator [Mameliella sediminis]|uniref:response regulator n=1 Tax=Mameliella sediminis TaxID=2836866 RepID=UPI001C453B0E|nr:response regulator [Mameliella sediminis]MBY6112948.1 response regulator [Antarctobacter heliothermus]MBY6143704.1 response regulator [Mameliella alba]MBV7394230.1 response regulator [Mameliella sediminis]MBY6162358.1 response regulator [Mameliella alba]MBY6170832.1 response regulator [Mameliella alba]